MFSSQCDKTAFASEERRSRISAVIGVLIVIGCLSVAFRSYAQRPDDRLATKKHLNASGGYHVRNFDSASCLLDDWFITKIEALWDRATPLPSVFRVAPAVYRSVPEGAATAYRLSELGQIFVRP